MAVNQKRSLAIAGFTFQNNDLSDFCGRLFKHISQPFIPKSQGIYLHSFVLIVETLIDNTVWVSVQVESPVRISSYKVK